ncbi:hypothetical protein DSO57_1030305 [Entomophthora muscae]|uniref:Uncharacterized protein n=1 Tax=Entomophthora muscae TaxID=34485 RepID=A0ACC2TBT1_9FUNG|nr:hypothetical protein DSO57_1030305 [Entomophthora muscae]
MYLKTSTVLLVEKSQHKPTILNKEPIVVKPQNMREYFSKVGYQVGDLESCERRHNGVDRHHPSEDLATDWVEWGNTSVGQEYCLEEFSCAGSS